MSRHGSKGGGSRPGIGVETWPGSGRETSCLDLESESRSGQPNARHDAALVSIPGEHAQREVIARHCTRDPPYCSALCRALFWVIVWKFVPKSLFNK